MASERVACRCALCSSSQRLRVSTSCCAWARAVSSAGQLGPALGDGVLDGCAGLVSSASARIAWACCSAPARMRAACSRASWTARSAVRWARTRVLRKRLVAASRLGRGGFGPLGPLHGLAQPVLQDLEAGGHLLEEVIDILGVVAPHLLAELDLTQRLGRDVHGRHASSAPTAPTGTDRRAA